MPFISENELERALVKAAQNPASAPDFYRLLLESDLLVLGTVEGQEDATDQFTLAPGGRIALVSFTGSASVPELIASLSMDDISRCWS